jgi:hypothetical protein
VVGLEVEIEERVGKVKHAVTHHRITLYGFTARSRALDAAPVPRDCAALCWESPDILPEYPFSAPQALLRAALLKRENRVSVGEPQSVLVFEEAADYDA